MGFLWINSLVPILVNDKNIESLNPRLGFWPIKLYLIFTERIDEIVIFHVPQAVEADHGIFLLENDRIDDDLSIWPHVLAEPVQVGIDLQDILCRSIFEIEEQTVMVPVDDKDGDRDVNIGVLEIQR